MAKLSWVKRLPRKESTSSSDEFNLGPMCRWIMNVAYALANMASPSIPPPENLVLQEKPTCPYLQNLHRQRDHPKHKKNVRTKKRYERWIPELVRANHSTLGANRN